MKYLVMESANSYAVLLDEQGRFVTSANLGYEIGDTVTNPVILLDKPLEKVEGRSKVTNRVLTAIVAIAAMILLVFGISYYQQTIKPYTSIYMAINPEVEMVLNKSGKVIDVTGTNEDGRTIVESYDYKGKNKSLITNELVSRAIEMGYLAEGGYVSIAIDTPDEALFEQYGIDLRRDLEERTGITIEITDMENRNQRPNNPSVDEPADDSGYDKSSYDEPAIKEPKEPSEPVKSEPESEVTPKPAPKPNPNPKPVPDPAPKPAPQPVPVPEPKPKDNKDTDYDDSDYDTDYDDDSDYDDSDYRRGRSNKGKRDKRSNKRNKRHPNGYSNERNSSGRLFKI